ncbi:ATP-binding cassette domain-containing protein [Nocardiopsis changdeensis]|uniref:ATP-binding cassette domain-containing protein n=1 Tax=Nocardiopsis changdeensis TaxID=2831969 RepID=A0ABX8BQQ7_9ACTN|nr:MULTISPECIES: ATP-binding cassette domain-containing protein [Nocardiopsis]QUX24401.1 ATP-binding cassette domain-containing protein [Nocardiopsis changdeensis]QYX34792.1 ATP-binding cassette domain-containing protein [Nocardiopsis sp. MT53]
MENSEPAVLVEGLHKAYGDTRALDGLDMTVERGTVHAILGPNGAGKTTLVRTLATLLRVQRGRVEVDGVDVATRPRDVRRRIGLLGQHAALDEELSGRQNLELFGRLHHLGDRRAATRAGELLERFGLADTGKRPVSGYSGGMRRRLDLAASLIVDPAVLFLDEPTTGLDPRGRTEVWESVRSLVGAGTTVLLTTQYLEEADQLADLISVVDGGRVIAEGTADRLKGMVGGDRLDVVIADPGRLAEAAVVLGRLFGGSGAFDLDQLVKFDQSSGEGERARRISLPVADRRGALARAVRALDAEGIEAEDLAVRRPTLDEVFLRLTGSPAEPPADAAGAPASPAAGVPAAPGTT